MSDDVNRILVKSNTTHDFVIRLARAITEPDDFADEFQILAGASDADTIKMQLVSGGGSMDTAIMMIKAMNECKASIKGWIGPTCASACTAIALACDEWEVDDMSAFMIHTASFASGWGKAPDVVSQVLHQNKMIERFVRITYDGFLTEGEIIAVLRGEDFYCDGEELADRLERYATKRDEKRQAMLEDYLTQSIQEEESHNELDNHTHNEVELAPVEAA